MSRTLIAALAAAATITGLVAVPASSVEFAAAPASSATAQVLTWTADDSTTAYTSAPTEAVAGATTIVFENSEATGNTTGMTHTLTFDTSTPGYNHDVDVNITASPFDSNNGRHEVQATLTPGKYRYFCAIPGHGQMVGELIVTDDGGGEDTTPPTVAAELSGEQNADGAYVGSATVTVAAEDTGSGVASVEYEIDDTGFKPYTEPVVVSDVGDHAVQYRATDAAGNVSETGSTPFTVVQGQGEDTTPPAVAAEVAGEQDADGNYVGSATVTVTAADDGSGVQSVEYNLDDAGWTAYTEPVAVSEPGEHMLHYRATDAAGNVSAEGMAHFTVVEGQGEDTMPPTVTATATGTQNADWTFVGDAVFTLTATDDDSGVASIEYALDHGAWTTYGEPLTVTRTGDHTVSYRATDKAGNVSEEQTGAFTIVK
ncbi:MAG: OmpL47-type beta-barrel domain-containing protein [Thermocrispum sp.]